MAKKKVWSKRAELVECDENATLSQRRSQAYANWLAGSLEVEELEERLSKMKTLLQHRRGYYEGLRTAAIIELTKQSEKREGAK